ncbi:MAG: ribbon-helix-helix domain-containing protein [Actinomycetota bacterium]
MTTAIAFRLPDELVGRIDELVPDVHESRSAVIRRALEIYLTWLANERDAAIYERLPLTDAELALADDPAGWADAPAW